MTQSVSRAYWRALLLVTTCLVPAVFAARSGFAQSRPQGATVTAGQATVAAPNARTTIVTQSSAKAVIDWSSFSIGRDASVTFQQPSTVAIALNRVRGPDASIIEGKLSANGQIWLVNANGVLFGPGAHVDVGGLIATTADIANSDFLAGNYSFAKPSPNPDAGIANKGKITAAPGGSVSLAAAHVENQGVIAADLGTVVVAGAKTFAVDLTGDKLLRFAVTGVVDQRPEEGGQPVDALVNNTGKIRAAGGKVLITARAAKGIVDQVINSSGIVEARTARQVNGEVVFDGGDTGMVEVTGRVDVSGRAPGQTGGSVGILGDDVRVQGNAQVDASGAAGGGTVLIGGNAHGAGPQRNATKTTVGAKVRITADATASGNGGQVVLWSSEETAFLGKISARGGAGGGDGGFVETSSHGTLQTTGSVTAAAPQGKAGTWLLDPEDTVIANQTAGGSFGNGNPSTFTPTSDSAQVEAATISSALSGGTSVTITTGASGQQAGNILVAAPIAKTGGAAATLTLQAAGAIDIEAPISSSSGALGLNFNPGSGAITLNANLATSGGAIAFNGPVILGKAGGPTTMTLDTTSGGAAPAGASITFAGTVDAAQSLVQGLLIAAGSAGDVNFQQRVGHESPRFGGLGTSLGDVTITCANNVHMAMPFGTGGDGFAAKSLTVAGPNGTAGATTVINDASFISVSRGTTPAGEADAGAVILRTRGSVTVGLDVDATGGVDVNGVGGNGGPVTIVSGGPVSVGALIPTALNAFPGIFTRGFDVALPGQTAGNGGAVSITAASIALPAGVVTRGGDAIIAFGVGNQIAGAGRGGGNGGAVTLTATAGGVSIGNAATGDAVFASARGGNSLDGSGGAGGSVSISAPGTLALSNIEADGGDTGSRMAGGGGAAGTIALTSGMTSGDAIVLFGDATTTGNPLASVFARGGLVGISGFGVPGTASRGGTFDGAGGNIALVSSGGTVRLQASASPGLQGGPTVLLTSAGGSSSGAITIQAPIDGTTINTENLVLAAGTGTATVNGNIGSASALRSLILADNGSQVALNGAVTLGTSFIDQRGAGITTITGLLSVPTITLAKGAVETAFNGGVSISQPATLAGRILSSSPAGITFGAPVTLADDTVIDTSVGNGPIRLAALDGAHMATLNAGAGAVTLGPVGSLTPLSVLDVVGGQVVLSSATTIGAQNYAGAVSLGGTFAGSQFVVAGPMTLTADTALSVAGGSVAFGGAVDGNHALRIATPSTLVFNGAVGAIAPLTELRFATVDALFSRGATVGTIVQSAGAGMTVLNGPVTATGAGGVSLIGTDFLINAPLAAAAGNVLISGIGAITVAAAISATGGDVRVDASAGMALRIINTAVRALNTAGDPSSGGTSQEEGAVALTNATLTAGTGRTIVLIGPPGVPSISPQPPAPAPVAPPPAPAPVAPPPAPAPVAPPPAPSAPPSVVITVLNPITPPLSNATQTTADNPPAAEAKGTATALNEISPSAGPADEKADAGDVQPSDALAAAITAPLKSGPPSQSQGKKAADAVAVIPGMVNQLLTPRAATRGRGAASLDEDAPAWGNEASWDP